MMVMVGYMLRPVRCAFLDRQCLCWLGLGLDFDFGLSSTKKKQNHADSDSGSSTKNHLQVSHEHTLLAVWCLAKWNKW